MLGIPTGHEKDWYEFLKPQLREESKDYEFPAQYMFKDVPHLDLEVEPTLSTATLELMDRYGIEQGDGRASASGPYRRPRGAVDASTPTASSASLQRRPEPGHGGRARPGEGLRDARHQGGHRVPRRLPAAGADQRQAVLSRSTPSASSSTSRSACAPASADPGCRRRCQETMLIDEVCWYFPELKFVMRHGAEPWADVAAKLLLKWPNLYYSTSAVRPPLLPADIIDFANTRGADKVMYAGYFPMGLSLDRIFREMPDVPFKDEVWPKFLRENAVRVFRLERLRRTMQSNRYPFPMPFGWFQVGYPEDLPAGEAKALYYFDRHLVAWRDEHGEPHVHGRLLPAPRRPPRPRRHGRGLRDRVPVPRLEVRRRGRQHRHPLQRPDQPQGPARAPTRSSSATGWCSPGTTRTTSRRRGRSPRSPSSRPASSPARSAPHHVVNAGVQEMGENAVDSAHFRYVHNTATVPEIEHYETDGHRSIMKSRAALPHPAGRGRRAHRHRGRRARACASCTSAGSSTRSSSPRPRPIDAQTTETRFDFYVRRHGRRGDQLDRRARRSPRRSIASSRRTRPSGSTRPTSCGRRWPTTTGRS